MVRARLDEFPAFEMVAETAVVMAVERVARMDEAPAVPMAVSKELM